MEERDEVWQSRLDMLMAMSDVERKLFLIQEDGVYYKDRMAALTWEYDHFRDTIKLLQGKAKATLKEYQESQNDTLLTDAERMIGELKIFTNHKSWLRQQIKEAREKVQWCKREYRETLEQQKRNLERSRKADLKQPSTPLTS